LCWKKIQIREVYMSNQRYIRRPVEDAAIGRINKKSTVKDDRHRDPVTPNRESAKRAETKIMAATYKHEEEIKPVMENIINPYNQGLCQLCDYSSKRIGEFYCQQDMPVVRCYQILNCSVYQLRDEGVITTRA